MGKPNLNPKPKPFKCEECNEEFTLAAALSRHKKLHTEERLECRICSKSFLRKDNLNRHVITCEEKQKKVLPVYKCEKCNISYASKQVYSRHLLTEKHQMQTPAAVLPTQSGPSISQESKFCCQLCKITFQHKSKWDKHTTTAGHKRRLHSFSMADVNCNNVLGDENVVNQAVLKIAGDVLYHLLLIVEMESHTYTEATVSKEPDGIDFRINRYVPTKNINYFLSASHFFL